MFYMKFIMNTFIVQKKFSYNILTGLIALILTGVGAFPQEDRFIRILRPQLYLDMLYKKGYLGCGSEVRPGCCIEGYFPQEVLNLVNPGDVELPEKPTIRNARSNGTGCEKMSFPPVQNFQLGSMAGFYRLAEVDSQMARMRQLFPQYVSQKFTVPGITSHQGRPLAYYRISDNPHLNEDEPAIFFGAAIHAREPISVSNLIYFLWYLLENASHRPDLQYILNHTEIYVMPMINPDGYYYNETTNPNGGGNWRKNMRNNGDGTIGVDLNRNFPFAWGWDDMGSSPDPASFVYRGPYPASEPEVQAVIWLSHQEKFHYSLLHHSYGNYLIHPWNYMDAQCPDSSRFRASSFLATLCNAYKTGTCAETVGYLANGGSDDYLYADTSNGKNQILAMTPETGTYYDGFWPLEERIVPLCRNNLWLNLAPLYLLFPTLQHDLETPLLLAIGSTYSLPFQWRRFSDSNAVFVRTFTSLSPYLSVPNSGTVRTFSNPVYHTPLPDTLWLQVSASAPAGQEARVVLSWTNGYFSRSDTLTFYLGVPDTVLFTACDATAPESFSTNSWGYDYQTFVSPPASLSDSPGSEYAPDANNEIWFDKIINLSDALAAELSFYARWETEKSYDFVVPMARLLTGEEIPLCGRHTYPLFGYPQWGNLQEWPAYDGVQSSWVKEYISLQPLLGQKFRVGFRFSADAYVQGEGFFLDDLCVRKVTSLVHAADPQAQYQNTLKIFPNPAKHFAEIHSDQPLHVPFLDLWTVDGRFVKHMLVTPEATSITINTQDLQSGIYVIKAGDSCLRVVIIP